jgi:hypothetical protein
MHAEMSTPPPPPPIQAVASAAAAAPILTVNLLERRVCYRGVEIPTRPPRNLQRQPLLALAVLAEHAGQAITVVELAGEMQRLGGLERRLVAPEARDLRYKLLSPFRHALLRTGIPRGELDRLVETVAGTRLRLNVAGPVQVIGARTREELP